MIQTAPVPSVDSRASLGAQSTSSQSFLYPRPCPGFTSLLSGQINRHWTSAHMTLHGWPASAAPLAQVSFPTLPALGAGCPGGWETAHGGSLQLLPAAPTPSFLLLGTESALGSVHLPIGLKKNNNKVVIIRDQNTPHFDEVREAPSPANTKMSHL